MKLQKLSTCFILDGIIIVQQSCDSFGNPVSVCVFLTPAGMSVVLVTASTAGFNALSCPWCKQSSLEGAVERCRAEWKVHVQRRVQPQRVSEKNKKWMISIWKNKKTNRSTSNRPHGEGKIFCSQSLYWNDNNKKKTIQTLHLLSSTSWFCFDLPERCNAASLFTQRNIL